jgi:hypothetical protein
MVLFYHSNIQNLNVELSCLVRRMQPDSCNSVQRSLDNGGEGDESEPSVLTSSHLAGVDGGLSSDEIYSSQAFVTDTSRYTLLPAHPTSAVTDTCTTVPTTGRLVYLSKKNL